MKRRHMPMDQTLFRAGVGALALVCALALLPAGGGCGPRPAPPATVSRTFPVMGTFASVILPEADAPRLDGAVARAGGALRRVERDCSIFQPDSDISRLNAAAGADAVTLAPETADVLRLARRYGELSAGAFDITVGPLMRLWGFRGANPPLQEPAPDRLRETLRDVGWRHVILSNGTARLDRPGTRVDLGGIAKGYGLDRAWEALREAGFTNAMVNLGGNIRCLGAPDSSRPWRIAVRHPFEADQTLGSFTLEPDQAVATSGHYEQFVTLQGRRYTHVMDPRSGRPVAGMASVTVVARTGADADALSTALFVLGLEQGPEALERAGAVGALFVPDRQPPELWLTPGLTNRFTPHPALRRNVKVLAP